MNSLMKVLITGASGFTGRYLIKHISEKCASAKNRPEIYGLYNSSKPKSSESCRFIKADICNVSEIEDLISSVKPDYIIHLAGERRGSYEEQFRLNAVGTVNLLEAVRKHCNKSRILVVSSSAVYGYAGEMPISEDNPLRPVGAYGVSKAAGEMAALSFTRQYGMNITVARPFNLFGPGQNEDFVTGKIVKYTGEIIAGLRESFDLYSLDSGRDFVDVRDAVRAYWDIISSPVFEEKCRGEVFNIGSGDAFTVRDVIVALEIITSHKITVNLPSEILPEIVPTQKSDITKIKNTVGWVPEYNFEKTLTDMLKEY
ncbi:NAD-dependent epimerase/dehydratase [Methanoplanus limicola DSM 2279]|uniref:NAD-dependent epimerase/dehydratase n=2 Tax=Methanoplanus limicola TaxID=2315 RepID=H1YWV0_9EURY|nr:NAD-dependent epimerase/dehydratase [Methanoplanus limicola DSM 2279]